MSIIEVWKSDFRCSKSDESSQRRHRVRRERFRRERVGRKKVDRYCRQIDRKNEIQIESQYRQI